MHTLNLNTVRMGYRLVATAVVVLVAASAVMAADGTWIQTSDGLWSAPGSWSGGTIADGADGTANFNTLDVVDQGSPFFRVGVGLDSSRTIGNLIFGDTDTATPGAWEVYEPTPGTSVLTLSGTTPTITVNPLGPIDTGTPPIIDDAIIRMGIAGTSGLTKAGTGVLTLSAPSAGNVNTITGGINVNAGTFRVATTSTLPAQTITLGNGATFESPSAVSSMSVAAGATATYTVNGANTSASNVLPAGAGTTLNLNIANNNTTLSAGGDWTGFANLNLTGQNPAGVSFLRLMPNPTGGPPFFNVNSFANTNLNLDNVQMLVRTNSYGNTIPIGQLTGSATGVLAGGNAGSAARYELGGLNNSYTYAGQINGAGGLSINKVGTGTVTLAGTFTNSPAINNTPARQGGVFRVTAGTLAITGVSSIPGGPAANPTILTTVDVLPGASFDVSGAPATFTTSTQQKIQGGGTILGNWSHAAGQINPGDVGAATAANEGNLSAGVVATAGTLTFNGNLDLAGGNIIYDMSPSPASGNDLVAVTGTTTLSGGRVVPNFLSTIPLGGTYTVLTSTGGFSGSVGNILVDMPGRTPDKPLAISGNSLVFDAGGVVDGKALTWTGAVDGTWDLETTQNWTDGTIAERYFNLDSVAFPESGANKTITLNAVALPVGTVAINNASDYSFSGTGAVAGTVGLAKTGTGALTMSLNNTFTGAASVADSTVNVAGFSGLGAGPLTLSNATYIATISVSNSTLDIPTGTTSTIQLDGGAGTGGTANIPSLTGGGTLNLTSTITDKYFGTFNTAGFTGTLNVAPSGAATALGQIRIRGGQTNFSNAVVNLTAVGVSNQQGAAAGSTVTVGFGELHGDASTTLIAFNGGSATVPNIIWQIGALDTNSNFDGPIVDGGGSIAGLTKVGAGTLTLAGVNTYAGDTRVLDGTLSVTQINTSTTGDTYVSTGATYDLNFSGTDSIGALYLDNVLQAAGTWGSLASSATNKSNLFTGAGILDVTSTTLIGDYNGNGVVDAGDYTFWRDNLGGDGTLLANRNPSIAGVIGQADYDAWRFRFGNRLSGAAAGAGSVVPEPASMLLLAAAAGMLAAARRARRWN